MAGPFKIESKPYIIASKVVVASADNAVSKTAEAKPATEAAPVKLRTSEITFPEAGNLGHSEVQSFKTRGQKASKPCPQDGGRAESLTEARLTWIAGRDAHEHRIYMGLNPNDLYYLGAVKGKYLVEATLSGLSPGTRYYWRVDQVPAGGLVVIGDRWSFLAPGLVAWWKFDEKQGDWVTDASGNQLHGKIVGDPQWKPTGGKIGGALDFDGQDDCVNCGVHERFNIKKQITISAWVNIRAVTIRWMTIINKSDSAWRLSTEFTTNGFHFAVNDNTWVNGRRQVPSNEWHHVVGRYDGKTLRTYIDGKLDVSREWTGGIGTNDFPVMIGDHAEVSNRFWNGQIDEIRVYDCALTIDQIKALSTGQAFNLSDTPVSLPELTVPKEPQGATLIPEQRLKQAAEHMSETNQAIAEVSESM